jgi:23S rRNA pseudouridine2605 synthase
VQERLQKILSARGIASRRKAEEYIEQGLVKVNGKVAILGQKADPDVDTIEVDGKVLQARQEMLYYVMYKPVGVETSNVERMSNDEGRMTNSSSAIRHSQLAPTVRELLPKNLQGKIYPVGRLDKDSEGLLLFTNDGVLAYRLTHPKFDHEKEYEVTVNEPITDGQLRKLEDGIKISGEKTKPATVRRIGPATFRIALTEGRYRQIRRMVQKLGREVMRLVRVRIMGFTDAALTAGQIRELTSLEKNDLIASLAIPRAYPSNASVGFGGVGERNR